MNLRFLFPLVIEVASCRGEQDVGPSAGTRTHWLESCDTQADCDIDADCICNVCTLPCEADAECDGGTCAPLVSTAGLCGDVEEGRICLPTETVDSCSLTSGKNHGLGGYTGADCDDEGVVLCEDFEAGYADNYQIEFEDTEVRLDSCLRHEGSSSAAFSGLVDEGFGHVQMTLAEEIESGPLHLRLWGYVPSGQKLASLSRVIALRSEPRFTDEQVGLHWNDERGIRFSAEGMHEESEPDAFPFDEWFCLQMTLDVGQAGSAVVSINGQLVLEVTEAPTVPAAGPIRIANLFGTTFGPQPRFEFAVDDLVIGTSPLGCN